MSSATLALLGDPSKVRGKPTKYYEELKHLGSGAFGAAVLVRRLKDGRRFVAKKCCIKDFDEKQRAMCLEEITLLLKVRHPCIAEVVDFRWASKDGLEYWVLLKYYPGGDVQQEIDKCRDDEDELAPGRIKNWTAQLCMALQHVHALRIVHRDVKGSNLFITGASNIVLGDFGVSKQLTASSAKAMTSVGSPVFMAPEWWDGRGGTYASDMWSVGVVLYELLALKRPFEGGNVLSLVHKITNETPAPLSSEIAPDIRILVSKLLEKSPEKRPSAVEALSCESLRQVVSLLNIWRDQLEHASDKMMLAEANKEDQALGRPVSSKNKAAPLPLSMKCDLVAMARRARQQQHPEAEQEVPARFPGREETEDDDDDDEADDDEEGSESEEEENEDEETHVQDEDDLVEDEDDEEDEDEEEEDESDASDEALPGKAAKNCSHSEQKKSPKKKKQHQADVRLGDDDDDDDDDDWNDGVALTLNEQADVKGIFGSGTMRELRSAVEHNGSQKGSTKPSSTGTLLVPAAGSTLQSSQTADAVALLLISESDSSQPSQTSNNNNPHNDSSKSKSSSEEATQLASQQAVIAKDGGGTSTFWAGTALGSGSLDRDFNTWLGPYTGAASALDLGKGSKDSNKNASSIEGVEVTALQVPPVSAGKPPRMEKTGKVSVEVTGFPSADPRQTANVELTVLQPERLLVAESTAFQTSIETTALQPSAATAIATTIAGATAAAAAATNSAPLDGTSFAAVTALASCLLSNAGAAQSAQQDQTLVWPQDQEATLVHPQEITGKVGILTDDRTLTVGQAQVEATLLQLAAVPPMEVTQLSPRPEEVDSDQEGSSDEENAESEDDDEEDGQVGDEEIEDMSNTLEDDEEDDDDEEEDEEEEESFAAPPEMIAAESKGSMLPAISVTTVDDDDDDACEVSIGISAVNVDMQSSQLQKMVLEDEGSPPRLRTPHSHWKTEWETFANPPKSAPATRPSHYSSTATSSFSSSGGASLEGAPGSRCYTTLRGMSHGSAGFRRFPRENSGTGGYSGAHRLEPVKVDSLRGHHTLTSEGGGSTVGLRTGFECTLEPTRIGAQVSTSSSSLFPDQTKGPSTGNPSSVHVGVKSSVTARPSAAAQAAAKATAAAAVKAAAAKKTAGAAAVGSAKIEPTTAFGAVEVPSRRQISFASSSCSSASASAAPIKKLYPKTFRSDSPATSVATTAAGRYSQLGSSVSSNTGGFSVATSLNDKTSDYGLPRPGGVPFASRSAAGFGTRQVGGVGASSKLGHLGRSKSPGLTDSIALHSAQARSSSHWSAM